MSQERILRVVKILCECTDKEQGITLHEIKGKLGRDYVDDPPDEQRIRADLGVIRHMCDVIPTPFHLEVKAGVRNEYRYHLYRPQFGLDEARLVFDSVSTSKFLSDTQKRGLLSQMEGFLSKREVQRLRERVCSRPSLVENEALVRHLHLLYSAIQNKSCVRYDYYRYDVCGKKKLDKRYRKISPVRIIWSGEHYYLSAVNPEHGKQHTYRIDRMQNLATDEGMWLSTGESEPEYRQFEMFEPKARKIVTFRIHRDLIDMAVEVLGPTAIFRKDKASDWSVVSAEVEISEGFYRWVLQQGGKLEILQPKVEREEIKERLTDMLGRYSE